MNALSTLSLDTFPPEELAKLEAELRRGWKLDQAVTKARQAKIGKVNQKVEKSVNGLGQLVARIDANSFTYWGKKEGFKCWDDKQFLKEYLRDNEASRVKSVGTKIQVGFRG